MTNSQILIVCSSVVGLSAAWLARGVFGMALRARPTTASSWEFEEARRIRLRQGSAAFRWMEPIIDELARRNARRRTAHLETIARAMGMLRDPRPWRPEELLAVRQLESGLAAVAAGLFGYFFFGDLMSALGTALLGGWLYLRLTLKSIQDRARRRLDEFRSRLPFAVDLMAFMMEAGASFLAVVQTVITENRGHVIAEELGEVVREVTLGRSRHEALNRMHERLRDEDVGELVFAIIKGEEMGTPLSQILRSQADQMRLKRSQWAEKAAAEAQVMIVFPGMLIMLACLILIVAPFVLGSME